MKNKFSTIVTGLVAFTVFLLVIFTILNRFTQDSYVPVHKKWFLYGEVVPPADYDQNVLRDIDIDLLAPKENSKLGDFYWLQTSGDLITLTNRNFRAINGTLSFDLEVDPCGTERTIYIGTQTGSMEIKTLKSKKVPVQLEFQIDSNSSEFLSIVGSPVKSCKIDEDMDRNFLAKVTNLKVIDLKTND